MAERGRWQVVKRGIKKRTVVATYDTEAEADAHELNFPSQDILWVEFDPVVAWGDGKKSRYGPTYASQVNDDWLSEGQDHA